MSGAHPGQHPRMWPQLSGNGEQSCRESNGRELKLGHRPYGPEQVSFHRVGRRRAPAEAKARLARPGRHWRPEEFEGDIGYVHLALRRTPLWK